MNEIDRTVVSAVVGLLWAVLTLFVVFQPSWNTPLPLVGIAAASLLAFIALFNIATKD